MFKMNSQSTRMYQSVTTWFLFWFCASLLSARLSQDTALLCQEMIEIVVDNLKNMGIF